MTHGNGVESTARLDSWSPWPAIAAFVATTVYWWCGYSGGFLVCFMCFLAAIAIAGWGAIVGFLRLGRHELRGASSALAAVLICLGGFFGGRAAMPYYVIWTQNRAFAFNRTSYDHVVAEWRAQDNSSSPFKLVVDTFDHSFFLTGLFDNIVYDESDAVGVNPYSFTGTWPCAAPGWTSKKIVAFADGRKFSRPLGGHFYFVEEIEP